MKKQTAKIKIFGERNTGTRAAIKMIEAADGVEEFVHPELPDAALAAYDNWIDDMADLHKGPWRRVFREAIRDQRQEFFGPLGMWKHSAAIYHDAFANADLNIVFMVRNPYSWLLALHKRPYHALGRRDGDFAEFISRPWATLRRDNVDPILSSPMHLWNAKMRSYPGFIAAAKRDGVPTSVISFEDFVHAPAHTIKRALRLMGVDGGGIRPARPTKPMGRKARERRDYYSRERWRNELSANAIRVINAAIDWEIAASFGYEKITVPSDRKTGAAAAA